jgi:Protein of unknown function (DUF2510)
VSYQQPPDHRPDAPAGPPPGWYPDPGGLPALRWWDGARWGPQTQPMPGIRQEPQPPYPDASASASGGSSAFRQETAGRHRQQSGPQDGTAYPPDLAPGPSPAPSLPAQPEQPDPYRQERPQDPYQPQRWPDRHPGVPQQQPYGPGPQPKADRGPRRGRNRKLWGALIGLSALIGIIVGVSVASEHNSPSARNAAATAAAASAPASGSPSAAASTAPRTYPDQAADSALCKTFTTDIASGETFEIQTALQQDVGSVSAKLARDIQAVVNGTTLQQDIQRQVQVAVDCGLVQAGVSPGS